MVLAGRALPGLLSLLGIEPFGRGFLATDHVEGEAVILSHELWQSRYGADPSVLGSRVTINGELGVVVGVLPQGLWIPAGVGRRVDLLLPMDEAELQTSSGVFLTVLGRLGPGVGIEAAEAEVRRLYDGVNEAASRPSYGWSPELRTVSDATVGPVKTTIWLTFVAVTFVLLIACANVACLLIARGADRQRELAIRSAIGASRGQLTRQLLAASVLTSLSGGVLGVALAVLGTRALVALMPPGVPRLDEVGIDVPVLGFALAVSIVTGITSGLLPALGATKLDLRRSLSIGNHVFASPRSRHLRSFLIVSQVALALSLSVGASLLAHSFLRLQAVEPGFRYDGLLTQEVHLPAHRYPDQVTNRAAIERIVEHVRELSAVEDVAVASWTPLSGRYGRSQMSAEGDDGSVVERERWAMVAGVAPGYFRTLDLPLQRGRDFLPEERWRSSEVVIVNERFARGAWGGQNPIGKRIKFGGPSSDTEWLTVIGLVGDARLASIAAEEDEVVFLPLLREERNLSSLKLIVRATAGADPAALAPSVRDAIDRVDNELPVESVSTMAQLIADNLVRPRFHLLASSAFAFAGLFLAGVGLYSVVSRLVATRSKEVGLRLALGATRRDILTLVTEDGMTHVAIGSSVGLALAFAGTRFLASLLHGVSPLELESFVAATFLLLAVGLVATLVPALRATRIDPASMLRDE